MLILEVTMLVQCILYESAIIIRQVHMFICLHTHLV